MSLLINFLESMFMLLFVAVNTWDCNRSDVIESDIKYSRIIFSIFYIEIINLTVQFIVELKGDTVLLKLANIAIIVVAMTFLFSIVWGTPKKKYIYALYTFLAFLIIAVIDSVVLGVAILFDNSIIKESLTSYHYYWILCLIAIGLKFIVVLSTVLLKNKNKLYKLTSTSVYSISKTTALFPSFWWFYTPRTPKSLNKKKG